MNFFYTFSRCCVAVQIYYRFRLEQNNYRTLGIVAIAAAIALTAMSLVVPHEAFAGGHREHHNNNDRNGIDVSQQVNQLNACQGNGTACLNTGANSADVGHSK